MDNNTFLHHQATPSARPLRSVQPQPTLNGSQPQSTSSGSQPQPAAPKTHQRLRPATVGAISAILGLTVGAAGIYGLIKLTGQSQPCPECDCSKTTSLSSNDLDLSFLKLEADTDNIIYSPLSIRNGLALLRAGAGGNTKTEIEGVLGDATIPKYQNIEDTLSTANAVFIRDTFKDKVLPTYTETVQKDYDGEVLYDSFDSSDKMDEWVSNKTFHLIDQIGLDPTQDLRMVLVNALAIQMDWQSQFDEDNTYGRAFYQKDGSEVHATTMYKETTNENIKYYTDDSVTALSMPLDSTIEDANLDFIAIMPSGDLNEYIGTVDQSKISTIIDNFSPANKPKDGVVITIPKFKFDYQLKFKEDLESLGVKSAFSDKAADFSNMASDPLYVSTAIHKANIDFSEDGIKAAAITIFAMDIATALAEEEEPQPVVINIDHPFLFLIRDAKNGVVWFTGAVYQPNLWADDAAAYAPEY